MTSLEVVVNASAKLRVLVLGGRGFIGRHAVAALLERGAEVAIGSRKLSAVSPDRRDLSAVSPDRRDLSSVSPDRRDLSSVSPDRRDLSSVSPDRRDFDRHRITSARRIQLHQCTQASDWHTHLHGFDVVLNCVGILRQRHGETYEAVHHLAVAALAQACHERTLRLVHISALGLVPTRADGQIVQHRSRFLRSKVLGERALLKSSASAALVRPSLLDGEGGFGALWIRRLGRLPLQVVPANATGRIAPLDVRALGAELARICFDPNAFSAPAKIYELGGDTAMTMAEYLAGQRKLAGLSPALQIRAPGWLVRLAAHCFDLLHFSPLSFGHYELMQHDNLPGAMKAVIGSADAGGRASG
jgi:uncharacterized protein YbjT (DUF2867 family)